MKNFNPFTDEAPGESMASAVAILEKMGELPLNVRNAIHRDGNIKAQAESLADIETEKSAAEAAADAAEAAADAAEAAADATKTNAARAAAYEALADAAKARAAAYESNAAFLNLLADTLEKINSKLIDVSRDTYTFQIHSTIEATGKAAKESKRFASGSEAAAAAYVEAAAAATAAADAHLALVGYAYADLDASDSEAVSKFLGAYPESVEFKRLYPDYMEDTISILHPHYQYELRAIDEGGSVFETDSLIIEYNADTGESASTYLCTEPDGDRVSYDQADLAEAMAGVC